jgi:16S rRNA (guanine966-N2)-methyltransferase
MRVIAGRARGVPLVAPPGTATTRPIADRAKEALFSILGPRVPGARFLDLFAGTGAVGIEALSRGARAATFVERDPVVVRSLRTNLSKTGLGAGATVVQADVFAFLRRQPEPFDLAFVGPPQWKGLWPRAVLALDDRPGWVADDATVVLQCDPREEGEAPDPARLERTGARRYGNVLFLFYRPVR